MFGFKKKEPEVPKSMFTPVYFDKVCHLKFNTRQELAINKAKAKREGFIVKSGDYYGCGWYLNLYVDPRRKKKNETVR